MSRTNLLKKISKAISPHKVDFSAIDNEINVLKKKLEETVNIQTVDDVKYELDKFKKKIDLSPIITELNNIGDTFTSKVKDLQNQIDEKSKELEKAQKAIEGNQSSSLNNTKALSSELTALRKKLAELEVFHEADVAELNKNIAEAKAIEGRVNNTINSLTETVNTKYTKAEAKKYIKEAQDKLDSLRLEVMNRFSTLGGGSMNRQIFIGGVDPLKMYTDINFKAGTNVTISYANNNQTKKVDVTLTATGTGGSVRSINSISTNQTAGSTAGTDYVYLVSGTTQLTMPTAVGNTNLYTIKNVGVGVVTIVFAGVETCDGSTSLVMPVQFTSVDIISDTVNWNIT